MPKNAIWIVLDTAREWRWLNAPQKRKNVGSTKCSAQCYGWWLSWQLLLWLLLSVGSFSRTDTWRLGLKYISLQAFGLPALCTSWGPSANVGTLIVIFLIIWCSAQGLWPLAFRVHSGTEYGENMIFCHILMYIIDPYIRAWHSKFEGPSFTGKPLVYWLAWKWSWRTWMTFKINSYMMVIYFEVIM